EVSFGIECPEDINIDRSLPPRTSRHEIGIANRIGLPWSVYSIVSLHPAPERIVSGKLRHGVAGGEREPHRAFRRREERCGSRWRCPWVKQLHRFALFLLPLSPSKTAHGHRGEKFSEVSNSADDFRNETTPNKKFQRWVLFEEKLDPLDERIGLLTADLSRERFGRGGLQMSLEERGFIRYFFRQSAQRIRHRRLLRLFERIDSADETARDLGEAHNLRHDLARHRNLRCRQPSHHIVPLSLVVGPRLLRQWNGDRHGFKLRREIKTIRLQPTKNVGRKLRGH